MAAVYNDRANYLPHPSFAAPRFFGDNALTLRGLSPERIMYFNSMSPGTVADLFKGFFTPFIGHPALNRWIWDIRGGSYGPVIDETHVRTTMDKVLAILTVMNCVDMTDQTQDYLVNK